MDNKEKQKSFPLMEISRSTEIKLEQIPRNLSLSIKIFFLEQTMKGYFL